VCVCVRARAEQAPLPGPCDDGRSTRLHPCDLGATAKPWCCTATAPAHVPQAHPQRCTAWPCVGVPLKLSRPLLSCRLLAESAWAARMLRAPHPAKLRLPMWTKEACAGAHAVFSHQHPPRPCRAPRLTCSGLPRTGSGLHRPALRAAVSSV